MHESTNTTQMVWRCTEDALYRGSRHPETITRYTYDSEGYIQSSVVEYYYFANMNSLRSVKGLPRRCSSRNAFDIEIGQTYIGTEGNQCRSLWTIQEETDTQGLLRRVVTLLPQDDRLMSVTYTVGGYGDYRYRRALKSHICRFDPQGRFEDEYRYEYDSNGWILQKFFRSRRDVSFSLSASWEIAYNKLGHPVRYGNYVIDNTYDDRGLVTKAMFKKRNPYSHRLRDHHFHVYDYQQFEIIAPVLPEKDDG